MTRVYSPLTIIKQLFRDNVPIRLEGPSRWKNMFKKTGLSLTTMEQDRFPNVSKTFVSFLLSNRNIPHVLSSSLLSNRNVPDQRGQRSGRRARCWYSYHQRRGQHTCWGEEGVLYLDCRGRWSAAHSFSLSLCLYSSISPSHSLYLFLHPVLYFI